MFYLLFKNAYSKFLFQTLNVDFQRGQYINYNQRKQREKRQFLSTGVQNLSELRRSVNTTGGGSGVTSVEVADPDAFEEQLGEMAGVLPIRDPLSTVTTATGVSVRAYNFHEDPMEEEDIADPLFANYEHYSANHHSQSHENLVNVRTPNMSAPSTIVRPSQADGYNIGIPRQIRTDTGEIVTVLSCTQQSSERVDDDELPDIRQTVNLEQLPQLQAPPAPMPSQGPTREDRRPPPAQNTGGARQRQAAPVRRSVESVPVRRRVNRETPQER